MRLKSQIWNLKYSKLTLSRNGVSDGISVRYAHSNLCEIGLLRPNLEGLCFEPNEYIGPFLFEKGPRGE